MAWESVVEQLEAVGQSSGVPMHGGRRKCRQAHGNILGALRTRGAVPDPLSARGHDGLSGADLMDGGFGFDAKQPAKDESRASVSAKEIQRQILQGLGDRLLLSTHPR